MIRIAMDFTLLAASGLALCGAAAQTAERVERGNLIFENAPETPDALAASIRQYEETRSASFAGFDADGEGPFHRHPLWGDRPGA